MNISELQHQQYTWQTTNFGKQEEYRPLLGMIEELGELARGQLKYEQNIRGTKESHFDAQRDAIADVIIYLFGFCSAYNVSLSAILGANTFQEFQRSLKTQRQLKLGEAPQFTDWECIVRASQALGKVCKYHNNYWPKAEKNLYTLVLSLARYCNIREWNLQETVEETWNTVVKKRNWVADPTGGTNGSTETKLS